MKILALIMLSILQITWGFSQNPTKCSDLVVENLAMENDSTMKITIRNTCTGCASSGYCNLFIIRNSNDTIAGTDKKCFCLFSPAGNGMNNPKIYYIPSKVTAIPAINQLRVSMACVCDTIAFSSTLGINENKKKENGIKIFPNPATNQINIQYTFAETIHDAYILFTDLQGKTIKKINLPETQGTHTIVFEDNEFHSGLLQCTFYVNNKLVESQKLIISK